MDAGITPLSMDTADSGWVTSLMLGAMIGESDEGEQFMNTMLPTDYNTKEFIDAATRIQTMFQNIQLRMQLVENMRMLQATSLWDRQLSSQMVLG